MLPCLCLPCSDLAYSILELQLWTPNVSATICPPTAHIVKVIHLSAGLDKSPMRQVLPLNIARWQTQRNSKQQQFGTHDIGGIARKRWDQVILSSTSPPPQKKKQVLL